MEFPPFRPHYLLQTGHAQTLAGFFFSSNGSAYRAVPTRLDLLDGDALVLHDDCPADWRPKDPIVLLIHGLAGCHLSPYMIRVAAKLNRVGQRTFRMDMRTCGSARTVSRSPYHAGRSDDAKAAVYYLADRFPGSPIHLLGFSLGANVVLKYLADSGPNAMVVRAAAVNPPVDLALCCRSIQRPAGRIYDRYFARLLWRHVHEVFGDSPTLRPKVAKRPDSLWDFDDCFTAPAAGFADVEEYYRHSSTRDRLDRIAVPLLILAAADDPMIPAQTFADLSLSTATVLHISRSGGHLGYIARRGVDPDRRWMDWRLLQWFGDIS